LTAAEAASIRRQLQERPGAAISVDLERQTLTAPDGTLHRFEVDAFRKQSLLRGQDEIALTMEYAAAFEALESRRAAVMPWLT